MEQLLWERFFSIADFPCKELFQGVSYPWEAIQQISPFLEAQLLGKIEIEIPTSVYLVNRDLISIGRGTVIEPGAYIEGPVMIGSHNRIRHNAYIRKGVITGDHCLIGHGAEVKHSIFLNRASAAHLNYVGDSILGNGVNLGAGAKLANFRFDRKTIFIYLDGVVKETGLQKLGSIVGDFAQVGCNCVADPGSLIGPRSRCYPGAWIRGVVPPESLYKGSV